MNTKNTYPIPSQNGLVRLNGYNDPLPQQAASAIAELGNENLRVGAEAKLRSALETSGTALSVEDLARILVENNGLAESEAQKVAANALR